MATRRDPHHTTHSMHHNRRRQPPHQDAPPTMRAWHVITATGADTTVAAHECDIYGDGILAFLSTTPDIKADYVIVRAFAPNAWLDVDLVETDETHH